MPARPKSSAWANHVKPVFLVSLLLCTWLNFDPHASSKRFQIGNAIKLLLVTLIVGFVFYRAADLKTMELIAARTTLMTVVDFVIGAILGATMAHFVVDAGAWRLSQALQRMYIGKRFAFVFGPRCRLNRCRNCLDLSTGSV